jgi:hypothetical protein
VNSLSKTQKKVFVFSGFRRGFSAFVCAENIKSAKTIVEFWELFFLLISVRSSNDVQLFSVIGICAARAISPLMNEVVEPRFFSNSNKQKN